MNAKALHRLSWRMLKIERSLTEAVKKDPALQPLLAHANALWRGSYQLADQRNLEAARRKDGDEVLWTLFFPREYSWEQQKVITRTPNRRLETLSLGGVVERVREPERAYSDLAQEWLPADLGLMRKRAEMVDAKPREYWANLEEAA
jgi:hypothetical protein